ncbi:MAG TPA: hypothetical protein VK629_18620, partial [Steroidobacteraceae bacterium]|nr:hypothetical protein [Steroidobacteraceae bacterium]
MLAPRDLLQPGAILLVEWAERGSAVLKSPDMTIFLRYPEGIAAADVNNRTIVVSLHSPGVDPVFHILAKS